MRQKLMLLSLLLLVLISGCRKDLPAEPDPSSQPAENAGAEGRFNHCRLISDDRDGSSGDAFHYNNRGLVDQWKQDYYDGFPDVYTFTYDIFGRLKTGHGVFGNGFAIDITYQYQGTRLVKETVYAAGTTNKLNEIATSYNFLGQVIKRGSTMYDEYCTFAYNIFGNNTLVNYYVDGALWLKEEFTYRKKNRNPLLSLEGMPFVVFRYDFVFSNWWETSDKFTIYEEGVPTVTVEYDPNSAVMDIGQEQYLQSVANFDLVAQQNTIATFNYENCGGHHNDRVAGSKGLKAVRNSKAAIIARLNANMYSGQPRNIKDEIRKLKMAIQ